MKYSHLCYLAAAAFTLTAVAAPQQYIATDAGTIYLGALPGQDWGRPLTSGDLDNDGYDEFIVAASESFGGVYSKVYIVRGGPGRHGLGTVDLSLGDVDQVITPAAVDDNLGASMATGDVNGDGIDDLLLCASSADYGASVDCGIAYLIYGGPDFFASATRDLTQTTAWNVRFVGPVAYGDMGGGSSFGGMDAQGAAIGKLDTDIYGDVVLGVHLATGQANTSGRVYIIRGRAYPQMTLNLATLSFLMTRIDGGGEYDEMGTAVSTADLTGDGLDELIIGNHYASKSLFSSEGAVHIYRGRGLWDQRYYLGTTPADITLRGALPWDELGETVAVGDFNGDGIQDLIAAATGADAGVYDNQRGEGIVYGLLGAPTYQTGTHLIDYASATPSFRVIGEYHQNLGASLAAGDCDGDGRTDILAAEWFGGPQTNGTVAMVYGRAFEPNETFTVGVNTDLHVLGLAMDRIGFALTSADTNGDGLDELVYSAIWNNNDAGTAYVFTFVTGDADVDRDVDLVDYALVQAELPAERGGLRALNPAAARADFDLNELLNDLDLPPFAEKLTGPR